MSTFDKVSTLVKYQLPEFIREDHPIFVEFLEKYYEFLETPASPIYELKRFQDNYDVDKARQEFLKYFKNKIFPSFPDNTALSTEKIIKAARDFYTKKGTPEAFAFIFRALYNVDLEVFFPKMQILKASDGKWILPQAIRLTLSGANANIDINLLKKRKAYGSISRASCTIESINRTIDKNTNLEIVELYVSNINRLFQNGEYLEIDYTDENGLPQTFSEKIIGALSNVRINPNRRGRKYNTGDPIVINGGLDPTSATQRKAVATVGNVTTGSVSAVGVLKRGYGFNIFPDTYIDVYSANGVNANITVTSVDTTNVITLSYSTDAIINKSGTLLNAADYSFANVSPATKDTAIGEALSFDSLNLYPIGGVSLITAGDFYDEAPALTPVSLYDSDYYTTNDLLPVPTGSHTNYDPATATIQFVGGSFSSTDNWYNGWRLILNSQYRTITGYVGATKTATLERKFENNITASTIAPRNLLLDSRPLVLSMGRIAAIDILNGGSGYDSADTVSFIGTGYGAAATLTVSGGIITGVTLTNRGEGYVTSPTVVVNTSGGSGAILEATLLGDGAKVYFDVVTSSIGQVKDIVLNDRGSDYVSTPNVSLKVYDISVGGILESESILENDIVYQGTDLSTATFKATVDEYFKTNNIIRVFDYSGSISPGQNLIAIKTSSANVNTLITQVSQDGKTYPYRYGDGKAKANAEFLNGLIKYSGFYLNTDGHLSSDKKLEDKYRYHNFSYSLISEESYSNYGKTILDTVHPAGTKIDPIHQVKSDLVVEERPSVDLRNEISVSAGYINNCNVDFGSLYVTGTDEHFSEIANINDIIVINYANTHRSFTKTITGINSDNLLNIESPCTIIGEGRGKVTADLATLTISGNSNSIISFIDAADRILINVNNTVLTKTINSISGNIITMNSNTGITTTNANLIYLVYPKLNTVSYNVVRTIS